MNPLTCAICGHTDVRVQGQLVRWNQRDEGEPLFDYVPRCLDRVACRQRCEASGDPWPVADPGTPMFGSPA